MVIKRLNDALAAGDPIRAVIRGSLLNQDGKTETITSPSQAAQEALIRECYRKAGIDPLGTQYFEAHGTGTPTGDPIEAAAIAAVFKPGREHNQLLRIGSIKTNIGHLEATSGLASVVKVALSLEKGFIPPTINFENPNPRLALDVWRLKVASDLEPWPSTITGTARRASINSFGYGGANAHVIMEQPPELQSHPIATEENTFNSTACGVVNGHTSAEADSAPSKSRAMAMSSHETQVIILSAKDEYSCEKMITNLKEYLQQKNEERENIDSFLHSLAYTLGQRRTVFPWAAAYPVPVTQGVEAAIQALNSPKFKPYRSSRRPRIGMVFTGQGAQWHAMGRELIPRYPIFTASLAEAEGYLEELGADWSLMEELNRDAENTRVNETSLSIPICVAIQISLVRLLRSWGVSPAAVTSHSSGEIAAAYTVQAINYRQAIEIAYHRAVLAANPALRGPIKGGMVAIGLGQQQAEDYLARLTCGGKAVLACNNSPSSVTVAGDLVAVEEIEAMARTDGVFARRLRVDTGYHSHHMAPIADSYREALQSALGGGEGLDDSLDSICFSSPVTGDRIFSADEIADPEYWVNSLLQPVQFVSAFTDMVTGDNDASGSSVDILIEVGPHSALGGPIREILSQPVFKDIQLPYFSCLVRNTNARDSMQELAASLLRAGYPLNMAAVNFPTSDECPPPHVRVLTDLPPYPWNHQVKHWAEPRLNRAYRERALPPHDQLGSLVLGTRPDAPTWRNVLRISELPWVRDHVVQGNVVFPGAGYICLAIEAVKQMAIIEAEAREIASYRLRDVDILQALVVPENSDGIEIQTVLRPISGKAIGLRGWREFEVLSVTVGNRWIQHAKGLISAELKDLPSGKNDDVSNKNNSGQLEKKTLGITGYARRIDPADMFGSLRSLGIHHGPMFQNVKSIKQSGTEPRAETTVAVADTSVPNDIPRRPVIHPATLDSVIVSVFAALPRAGAREDCARVPRSIGKIWVSSKISHEPGHRFKTYSSIRHSDSQTVQSDVVVVDENDALTGNVIPVLEIQGLVLQSLGQSAIREKAKPWEREICSKMEWAPDMPLATPTTLASFKSQLSQPVDPEERRVVMDLRLVCVYFCQDALATLTASDVDQLEPHHVKFYAWMQEQIRLADSGMLGPGSETWTRHDGAERRHRISLVAAACVNGEMVCHLGPHLATMLRREKAPLELMMEGDRLLYRYYRDALKLDRTMAQLNGLLRRAVHSNPRARILEIGAGTGGATRHILPTLGTPDSGGPLAELYHFTDVSSGFFEAAREEFAPWSNLLAFDRLDIETDPATQGFALGSYDIVIACEVLHATKSMAHTMANVRSLMRPGGTLLLVETTQDQLDFQFVFGLLPGWWLSEEPQRSSSPSLAVPFWDKVLRAAGFSGVDIDIRDCECDEMYSLSAIMSRALPAQSPKVPWESVVVVSGPTGPAPPLSWLESLQATNVATEEQRGPFPHIQSIGLSAATTEETTLRGKICVFVGEVDQPVLHTLDAATLDGIRSLLSRCKGLVWVTRGGAVNCENAELALAHGFIRALREEYIGRRLVSLDLDPNTPLWSDAGAHAITQVLKAAFSMGDEMPVGDFEYAERDGVVLIPRLFKHVSRDKIAAPEPVDFSKPGATTIAPLYQTDRRLCLQVGIPGLLDSLAFGDDPCAVDNLGQLPPAVIEVTPRAYGLNFRDVMVAMGQLKERVMGLECAGVVTGVGSEAAAQGYAVGDRVFCLLTGSSFASRAYVDWHVVMHMPTWISFEDAASFPLIFSTAYMGLVDVARLRRGQSVLIHAAAGGVGQAAIMLAQHLGADIFVTVGTPAKRELIIRKYDIPADHIFSSRDMSFGAGVLAATNGRGVDVVLNSLAGPLLQESFNVLAPFGHFIEIGKRDLEQNSSLEMQPFSRHATFAAIDLLNYLRHSAPDVGRILRELVRLLETRAVAPVHPVSIYSLGEVSKAFRLLQTGKHTGKVVLSVSPHETVPVIARVPRARLRHDASYLLVGGMGGIGLSVAHWMVSHGAKNMILLSRSASSNHNTGPVVEELRAAGCRVKPINCDVSNAADLAVALRACEEDGLPPVRGVIQAAMVLQVSQISRSPHPAPGGGELHTATITFCWVFAN